MNISIHYSSGHGRLYKVLIIALILWVMSLFLVVLFGISGARINTTKSIPIGLYWVSDAPVEKGAYVMFCPPQKQVFNDAKDRGYIGAGMCQGGYGYMMKRVLATKNDSVSASTFGIAVNGKLIPNSAPRDVDGAGRPLPQYTATNYTLKSDELLLMSDVSAISFDGRYYGLIEKKQVEEVIRPIYLF